VVRGRSRNFLPHLIVPVIGFAVIGYILINTETPAKVAGTIWLAVGLAWMLVLKLHGQSLGLPEQDLR
jgi:hypothetical protein